MKTVLVVDDDDGIQAALSMMLEFEGYRVLQAVDGPSLAIALEQQPDLILLDVHMPALDSVEVSQQLRKGGLTAHIPIVAMTAAPNRAAHAGLIADHWLDKPFDLADLYHVVAHWTGRPVNRPLALSS